MLSRGLLLLGALALLSWISSARAAMVVIADEGGIDARPYLKYFEARADAALASRTSRRTAASPVAGAATVYPVRTGTMSPGDFAPRSLDPARYPGTPLCIVGDDDRSRAWLARHGARLRELQAGCLVVNVESPERLESLRRLHPGLPMYAASGEALSRELSLFAYPALVSRGRIEQ